MKRLDGLVVADCLDGRGDDGGGVFGMKEFEVHAAANIAEFEHGSSPGGTGDGDLDRIGAELGMTGDQCVTATEQDGRVAVIQGLNFEDGRGRKILQENAAFDLGSYDSAIDVIGEVGMRSEHFNALCGVYSKLGRRGTGPLTFGSPSSGLMFRDGKWVPGNL